MEYVSKYFHWYRFTRVVLVIKWVAFFWEQWLTQVNEKMVFVTVVYVYVCDIWVKFADSFI